MSTSPWVARWLPRALSVFPIVVSVLVGVLLGVGMFTFVYAGGANYFGNDPRTCNQCHAMNAEYEGWSKGPHKAVAGCNDCHSPHDNIVSKYFNKAENGFWHSFKFTTGDYPQNIKIRDSNRVVTEAACLYCHGNLVSGMNETRIAGGHAQRVSCLSCHSNVGHMR